MSLSTPRLATIATAVAALGLSTLAAPASARSPHEPPPPRSAARLVAKGTHDFDGDGKADYVTFHPADQTWPIYFSSTPSGCPSLHRRFFIPNIDPGDNFLVGCP